jgi:hypothetical protein
MDSSLTYSVMKTLREERKETGNGDRPDIDTGSLFSQGQIQVGTHSGSVGIPGSSLTVLR